MRLSYFAPLFCSLLSCVSASVQERVATPPVDDAIILNYALTLEYLKQAFYRGGLAIYGHADFTLRGFEDPFYETLLQLYLDGLTHVTFLTGVLLAAGVEPTVELQYTFPKTDLDGFVTLAAVFEGLSVSA